MSRGVYILDATTGLPLTSGVVSGVLSTATLSNVNDSASNVTLLASNSARRGAMIFNDSPSILYVKFGATATTASFTVRLDPYAYYEFPQPCYTGIVDGIWSADASGAARMTELT